jgi:ketosteroid isomerase-like protein
VSQQDVDVVRGLLAPFEAGDIIPIFRDEAVAAAMIEATADLFTDDFECVFVRQDLGRSTYRGVEGLRAAWLDWLAPWESYHAEVEQVIDLGDGRVLVLNRDHARPKDTEAEVSFPGAPVWTVRDGRVARIEFYWNRADGLAAAGLSEEGAASFARPS